MNSPRISRPKFPKRYVDNPVSYLTWDWVAEQLIVSENYWLSSVRPDGRPHVVPRWGAFLDNKLYYDGSPETRHAKNIMQNPHVTLHLESGYKAVILEGQSKPAGKPAPEFAVRLAEIMGKRYTGWAGRPTLSTWRKDCR